ncbi:hypothetical protein SPFM12_00266 [Salmonella phage SPFM12]|nr:hypothetical protein SPFM12_00266 [Salmonella phage SPFM12]
MIRNIHRCEGFELVRPIREDNPGVLVDRKKLPMGDSQIDRNNPAVHRAIVTGLYNSPTPTKQRLTDGFGPGNFPETHDRANQGRGSYPINLKGLKWGGPSGEFSSISSMYTNYLGCIDASRTKNQFYVGMVETLRLDKTGREYAPRKSKLLITNYQGEKEFRIWLPHELNATQVEICRALASHPDTESRLELFKEIYDFTREILMDYIDRYNPRWTFYLNAEQLKMRLKPLLAANQVDEAYAVIRRSTYAALFHMYWSAASDEEMPINEFGERVHVIRSMTVSSKITDRSGTKGIVGAVRLWDPIGSYTIRIVVRYPIPVNNRSADKNVLNKLAQPVQRGHNDFREEIGREYDEAMRKGEWSPKAFEILDKAFCSETYEVCFYNDIVRFYFAMSKDKNIVYIACTEENKRELDHYANALKPRVVDIQVWRDETKCDRGVNNPEHYKARQAGDFEKMERTGYVGETQHISPHFDRCEYVDADDGLVIAARRFDKLWAAIDSPGIDGVRRPQYLPNKGQAIRVRAIDFTLRDDEYLLDTYGTIIEDSYTISETAAKAMHAYG